MVKIIDITYGLFFLNNQFYSSSILYIYISRVQFHLRLQLQLQLMDGYFEVKTLVVPLVVAKQMAHSVEYF